MSDSFTLTIDGREVAAQPGMTVMQAADEAGIRVPRLCYHPQLEPFAGCRLCVVEVEGMKTLAASCALPAAPGMVVRTDTERVMAARRLAVELLLSDHPADCLTCELCGKCELQAYAYELGVRESPFAGARHHDIVDDTNPCFLRDYAKCILCGRCVSMCRDVVGAAAIDFAHRGFDCRVASAFGRPLQETTCVFCGQCVQVCPTGALVERTRAGQGREWDFSTVRTICGYCGVGCGLVFYLRDGDIIKVEGDEDNPVNRGRTCVKGRFGWDFLRRDDRLTTPLMRKRGKLVPVTWDQALTKVVKELQRIRARHGPDANAFLSSAKCTNEENYLMQRLARQVFGTNNVDHCARLCHASTVAGLALAFGSGAMTNTIGDLRQSPCIFVIGSNTSEGHPVIAYEIKQAANAGATVIVADPRHIELCDYAAHWLRQRPGSDVALVNAICNVILAEGLEDREFIAARTEGYAEVCAAVADCTPEWAEPLTGVPAEKIRAAARAFAGAERAAIVYAMGITQHSHGTDNVLALANLALLTGNLGKPGAGVNPLRGQNNVQGACDMGALPNVFPGYQRVNDDDARAKFEQAWGKELPAEPGLTVVEMMHAAEAAGAPAAGAVRGMYVMGENPALSDPDVCRVRAALEKLEFLVVQDIFLSETAEYAHVVLPGAAFAEKAGTFTNTDRRVQLLRRVLPPPASNAREDWQILLEVARAAGQDFGLDSEGAAFDEMAALTPSYAGMTHARLDEAPLHWPCPTPDHPGTPILHTERFTRGRGKFHAVAYRPPAEEPDAEYPLILTTGRLLYHYHTGTVSRRSAMLDCLVPHGYVEINPAAAAELGLGDGDRAKVISRRGEITIACRLTERVERGVVFIPFHFAESAANVLTNAALDPQAKIPELKVCAVRIQPAVDTSRL
ncbi:MAG TPA: formate dehydrogenase subunit alpha [Armatimonadota bacterium]|nr:formate dehydrogenase subunit alpha [Armatimonadota bacterium]